MVAGNGLFYPIFGFASLVLFIYMSFGDLRFGFDEGPELSFVGRNGSQFVVDGKIFYINGWNSYWLMVQSVDDYSKPRVREMLRAGAKMGLTVCRTWAFNDGDYNALQTYPGVFNEQAFMALDYVIAEARQHGTRLLLSLVNNLHAYGGKTQYVKWAWQEGVGLSSSNDSFFYDPSIRSYFKNYIKDWIEEMATFVKLIDKNHLVTVGLEGFYGPNDPKRLTVNPEDWASRLGSDFIRNSKISNIDFTSVHIYPDHWFKEEVFEDYMKFVSKWMLSHIEDGDKVLNKPVLFSEYGLSDMIRSFSLSKRETMYRTILDITYESAKKRRSGAGALVWQFLVGGMNEFQDDFGIVPWERSSTYSLFIEQSCRLAKVNGWTPRETVLKQIC